MKGLTDSLCFQFNLLSVVRTTCPLGQISHSLLLLLFLSGSHDSFTFWVDVHAPVAPDQKAYVKYLAAMFSVLAKKVMVKWSMTQVDAPNNQTIDLVTCVWSP